jgi:hypothetical protein
VKNAQTNNVLLFPVLTVAALKQADLEAALTLRIMADTSQEVLKYASDRIITSQGLWIIGVYYATVEEVALEIARYADRLTQIAENDTQCTKLSRSGRAPARLVWLESVVEGKLVMQDAAGLFHRGAWRCFRRRLRYPGNSTNWKLCVEQARMFIRAYCDVC